LTRNGMHHQGLQARPLQQGSHFIVHS
jgi:hypothetical protein